MNYSAKIDLENKIFFRAACLGVSIFSRGGILFCPALDGKLRALLDVYNCFFSAENRALIEDDISAWESFWREYGRETGSVRLPDRVYPADLEIEWRWLKMVNRRKS